MDSVGTEFAIRKLTVDDADAISEIYSFITKKPANDDFKKLVQEHTYKDGHEAHFVAELNGKVVGFMI
ncbi:MAG TPA: hypothetical protein PKE52_15065, partial [Bacteroidales bacterium]|nr:hypothetical protein [Bacteroidales bacterium]